MITYRNFTDAFPEFADVSIYPEAQFDFWLSIAELQINISRAGRIYDLMCMLYVAHNLVLSARERARERAGTPVGEITGATVAKSVGPVSVSYDINSILNAGASWWNLTQYGVRFFQIRRSLSLGGTYVPYKGQQPPVGGLI